MTTRDIISKLTNQIIDGIETEAEVVYLLAGVRKLIERDDLKEQFRVLNFHCDWTLHSTMDRAGAKTVLAIFDEVQPFLVAGTELPKYLEFQVDRISKMRAFRDELTEFLKRFHLPPLTVVRPDGWVHFLHLYAAVIADIPLTARPPDDRAQGTRADAPKHISKVVVTCELAPHIVKYEEFSEQVFVVRWVIYDLAGKSGKLEVFNSFSVKSE
jgi:hypothetical protein